MHFCGDAGDGKGPTYILSDHETEKYGMPHPPVISSSSPPPFESILPSELFLILYVTRIHFSCRVVPHSLRHLLPLLPFFPSSQSSLLAPLHGRTRRPHHGLILPDHATGALELCEWGAGR